MLIICIKLQKRTDPAIRYLDKNVQSSDIFILKD